MNARLNIILIAACMVLTWGLSTLLYQQPRHTVHTPPDAPQSYEQSGKPAPAATLRLMNGDTAQLADYKGRVVVLNFWATWCLPCAVEYPQMLRLAEAMPDLVILAVSVDAEKEAIGKFMARHGKPPANFIIAHDPEKKVSQDIFQTVQLPESYLIDSSHILREKIIGASVAWDDAAMIGRLQAMKKAR